ncbi:MAG: threonine/serine dehydratase [Gammaproteobacteria bacterium]|nr:MAG: threonine/serine dehydratase [Gammaproteobacteria bacterium]
MTVELPDVAEVRAAAARLAGVAVRTPLLNFPWLDERLGGRVFLKAEIFQRTGSFKFRGAWNRLVQLPAEARARGVVAFSSGNHAQGVAEAARLLGLPATIVMPTDAPAIKQAATRALGAEVVLYQRGRESREAIAARLAAERGATLVPAFDDPQVIAGQGTAGLEIAEDLAALGLAPDLAVICAGGGGLTAGCALALCDAFPEVAVYTAEPEACDDHRRSFISGRRERNAEEGGSICDALLSPMPGELTFAITARRCRAGFAVSDDEVRATLRLAFERLKLVLEPGGAVALAALLHRVGSLEGRVAVATLSGGNVDPELFAACLSAPAAGAG